MDANTLKTNKLFHKQLNLTSKSYEENSSPTVPLTDPPIVVTYSIDHNRVNNELNQTYDQMYLEFLISIQHREITPEDYEYLSRLDELVKKKTVNDNILKNLRSEQVNAELLAQLDQDQCGICLDVYALEQIIKYLPCMFSLTSDSFFLAKIVYLLFVLTKVVIAFIVNASMLG